MSNKIIRYKTSSQRYVPTGGTHRPNGWDILSHGVGHIVTMLLFILMLVLGSTKVWGQTPDYSGTYYIASDAIVNNKSTYDANTPANNYYLCPTDGWCYYKATNSYDADGMTYPNPFLTTYKWRDGVNDNKVIWIIEKCPNSAYSNYYYIKQHIAGNRYKYLMLNGKISGTPNNNNAKNRMRVHLEELNEDTDNPTINALFSITVASSAAASANVSCLANEKSVIITPKNTENEDSKCKYLVVNGGNTDALTGQEGKGDGPGSTNEQYKWTKGIVGLYYDENGKQNDNAPFYLENKPTITYSNQKIRITYFNYADNEVEIRYTDDGTPPTASSKLYEGQFDPDDGVTTIKAIAIKDGKESDVATFTPPFFLGSTHNYIIQSKNCKFYNMIPNLSVDENTKNVSTLNVPCSTMAWHFEDAEEGYYYIVDKNGWYMYYTTTNNTNKYIYLKSNKDDSDAFKFSITAHKKGGYSIIPKGQTKPIYKNNFGSSNAGLKPVMFDGTLGEEVARWDIIPYSTVNLPMWENAPFNVSTDDVTYYYTITPLTINRSDGGPLILNNDGLIKSETIPTDNYDSRKSVWVIKKVGTDTDGLLDYYTFQNAYTGELLYLNKKEKEIKADASPGMLQMGQPTADGADETWSHFVIVQTLNNGLNNGYNIIPRVLVDNTKAISTSTTHEGFNCINRANGGNFTGTWYDNDGGSRWTFALKENVKCMNPVFTEETDGSITIASVTNAAVIHYTDNGNNPDANSEVYTTKSNTSAQKVIKAIAIIGNDANTASDVVTLLNKPGVTLSQDTYTYDGTAKQPAVSEVSIGEASATAGTDYETVESTDYSNNINAGTAKVTLRDKSSSVYVWHAEKEFTINKKDLTATADDKTITYGAAVPTYTINYTGFENGENATTANVTAPTASCGYTTTSIVGSYPITISGGSAQNYNIIGHNSGTLTVNQREVGLSWSTTTTFSYDGNSHILTATATGLVNNDVIGVIVDGAQMNAGDYTATASALTGDKKNNYKLPTDNTKEFTIGKRPVSVSGITASDKEYDGTTTATLVLTGVAFAEGDIIGTDNVTVASATGTFADANAGTGKTVTIAITLGGTSVSNYELAGSGQQIETIANITKANLTATADNQTVTYGDAAPTYTITYAGWKNGESETVLTSEPTASSEYTQGSNVGSYPITLTGGDATNYEIALQNGMLTVTSKSFGDGTLAEGFNLEFDESGEMTLKYGSHTLTKDVDYIIGNEETGTKYSSRTISGMGNYSGTLVIRNAIVHFTTDTNQAEWSATFVAESAGATDIGHVLPEGIAAYIISGIEGAWAIPEPLDYIPAGVPVLLVAHEETNGFLVKELKSGDVTPITDDQKSYNKLKEVTAESAHFKSKQIYVLYKNEFVLTKEGDLGRGKVYMENPNYVTPSSPAPASLHIAWGNVTGIEEVRSKMEDGISERWYTLDGRCLIGKPTAKGLYIVGGKKIVVK